MAGGMVQFDLPGALQAHNALLQQQRQTDTQNALAEAVPQLQNNPQNAFATAAAKSPQAALQLLPYIQQLDQQKKAALADKSDALGKLAYTLKQYPDPMVRKAVAQSQSAALAAHGVTPDDLAAADYSDQALDMAVNRTMQVKDLIANSDKDRTFKLDQGKADETGRHNLVDETTAKGRLGVEQAQLGIARQKLNQPDFNAPVTIEVPDGKGATKQVLAQQDKKSGQWVSADEKRTPIDASGINMPDKSSGGARTQVQMLRMLSAAHTIGNELENVVALPSGANSGIFSGQNDTSVRGMLARQVTPDEAQSYNAVNTGLSRALAQMEAAGLAPPGSLTSQMSGLAIQAGNPEAIALQKLAHVRQTAEGILDSVANSPIATKKQLDEIAGLKARFAKAIPYTPMDVIKLQRKADPNASTIGDRAATLGLGPQPANVPPPPPGFVMHK